MQFNVGEIPTVDGFNDDGLTLLREPDEKALERTISIFFVLFVLIAAAVWLTFTSVAWPESLLVLLIQ